MRRLALFSTALVLAVAGCRGASDDSGDEPTEQEQGQGNAAVSYEELTEPYELTITPPEGFVAVDAARDPLLTEASQTWTFALDGGDPESLLNVTTYYLPEGTTAADFESQAAMILEYEAPMGNTIEATNIYPAQVHRQPAVHRYFKDAGGDNGSLFMRNFFMFAGQHVIQLTCQWRKNHAEVTQGCEALAQDFPFPAGWPTADPDA